MKRMNKSLVALMLCLLSSATPATGHAQLVFGPGPESPGNALDAIVAVVNDDVITRRELDEGASSLVERQLRQRKVPIPPRPVLENQVLERLILVQLQVRAAERNGITVDDATLNAAIETLAQRNNMNLTQMRQTVEKDGVSYAKFRDDVRREIMGARLRQKLVDSQIQVSEQDVESLQAQLAAGRGRFWLRRAKRMAGGGERRRPAPVSHRPNSGRAAGRPVVAARSRQRGAGPEAVVAQLRKGADFRAAGGERCPLAAKPWRAAISAGASADQLPTLFADVVPKLRPGQFSDPIRSP
jgi:peptidyl-prolyl cis-trans isomerase SurA